MRVKTLNPNLAPCCYLYSMWIEYAWATQHTAIPAPSCLCQHAMCVLLFCVSAPVRAFLAPVRPAILSLRLLVKFQSIGNAVCASLALAVSR
jgi:hypothetical protein